VVDPINTYSFSGDLGGGCGVLRSSSVNLHSGLQVLWLTLMSLVSIVSLRPKKRGADFSAPLKDKN
jgi:hypothetical protein